MKKIILKTTLLITAALLISCESTKQKNNNVDEYSDSESIRIDVDNIEQGQTQTPKTEKKETSSFFTKLLNLDKFTEVEETTLFAENALFQFTSQDTILCYNNKSQTAGFGSKYMGAYYYITFDETGRKAFKDAVSKYLSDFENKKLNRKDSKSFKAYGAVQARADFGTFQGSCPNYAFPTLNFGYKFKNNSPYFTITAFPVTNERFLDGVKGAPEKTNRLDYYFTKAQATSVSDFLDEEKIAEYFTNKNKPKTENNPDEY